MRTAGNGREKRARDGATRGIRGRYENVLGRLRRIVADYLNFIGMAGAKVTGERMRFTKRTRLILAVALTTGFWAVVIPMCWP